MNIFNLEWDITKAETLSSVFYTEDEWFARSKESVFANSWQLLSREKDKKLLSPHVLLEGFLDEPILMTVDEENSIHCLSNVCTHRGKILVDEGSQGDVIRCSYHGRCFSLDGKFVSMPEFEKAEGFPTEDDNLKKIQFETWNDFIFVSLNPSFSFSRFIDDVDEKTSGFDFANLKLISETEYEVNAHWALYCENYLEGFHIPFVHKSLNKEIDYGNYTTEIFPYSSLQTGYDSDGKIAAQYFFIFPNLMLNFYPWGISVNIVKPVRKDFTKIRYLAFVNDKAKLNTGAGANLEAVELEDQAVVESVQKGIDSRFYSRGRYSPTREQGTHHFHRLICEFMTK